MWFTLPHAFLVAAEWECLSLNISCRKLKTWNCLGVKRKKKPLSISSSNFKSALNYGARSALEPHEPLFMWSWSWFSHSLAHLHSSQMQTFLSQHWFELAFPARTVLSCTEKLGQMWSQPALGSSHHSQLGAKVAQIPPSSSACGHTIPGSACSIPRCLLVTAWLWQKKIPICKWIQSFVSSKAFFCLLCSLQDRRWGVAVASCSKHLK